MTWEAFWTLSSCRQMGMGAGPIPWDAIDRYAERHGLTGDEHDELQTLIRAMDQAYLRKASEK